MVEPLRLFPRPQGPNCPPCPLLSVCGSDRTDNACVEAFAPAGPAGHFALHPLRTDFDEHFARVGGATFDDIGGVPATLPLLREYLPQVKWLRRLRAEKLNAAAVPAVGVRIKEVFRGGRVRSAAELRAQVGLADDVAVVLLLHGEDALLERLWEADVADEIAAGDYALVTPPSFSLWEPRRRPDNLLSLRRSLVYYDDLVKAGANVCLRVGFVERRDVERLAEWTNRYGIGLVSLDLMTYQARSFDRAIGFLAVFDKASGQRCHFLADGVRAQRKIEALYLAAAPERVTVSNATSTPPPESTDAASRTLVGRSQLTRRRCQQARVAVAAAHASSVEHFIDTVVRDRAAPQSGGNNGADSRTRQTTAGASYPR